MRRPERQAYSAPGTAAAAGLSAGTAGRGLPAAATTDFSASEASGGGGAPSVAVPAVRAHGTPSFVKLRSVDAPGAAIGKLAIS